MESDSGYSSDWRNNVLLTNIDEEYFYSDDEEALETPPKILPTTEHAMEEGNTHDSQNVPFQTIESIENIELNRYDTILSDLEVAQYMENMPLFDDPEQYLTETETNVVRVGTERKKEIDSVDNTEKQRSREFFPFDNVPMELRWDEMEECIQEWANPHLADRMHALRMTSKEETNPEEPLIMHYEIRLSKLRTELETEREERRIETRTIERKAESLLQKLRQAVTEKEELESTCKQIQIEAKVRDKELQAETSLRKSKETVAKVLRGFCKDKEKELKEIREENNDLRQEIGELRMTIHENKAIGRTKWRE